MKKFLTKNLVIIIAALTLVVVFAVGGLYSRYVVNQKDNFIPEFQKQQEAIAIAGKGDKAKKADVTQLTKLYQNPRYQDQTFQPELVEAYQIFAGETEVAIVYTIITHGRNPGVKVAYALDIQSKKLIGIKVIDNNETPEFYANLKSQFFNQLKNKEMDNPVFKLDSVAGATNSSKAFEIGMLYARELFARDYDFEIPNVIFTIDSVVRNLNPESMIAKPFIMEITYGFAEEEEQVKAYFDRNYNYLETISGVEPEQNYKDVFKVELSKEKSIDVETFITVFDEAEKKLTIETKAYGGELIIVVFTLAEDLTSVSSIAVTTTQNYDSDYNGGYSGGNVPAVENSYKDQYLNDGSYHDAIAGATITSNAMIRILMMIDLFLEGLGGN